MEIKRTVKRLSAAVVGLTMLGATAAGALAAADLSNYPTMFVSDGTFDGFFVVGEAAASVDNLAMTDIAASMKTPKTGGSTGTVSVSGDNWMVGTSSKDLELANSANSTSSIVGETFRDVTTFIGDDELGALADGEWTTNEQNYGYQQFMYFDQYAAGTEAQNRIVKFVENDDDITADHLFFKNGRQVARYLLEFTSTAQSDVTDSAGTADSTGTFLDDFENTQISFLGVSYDVVLARRVDGTGANSQGIKLTLMAGSSKDTLLEGESKTYTVNGKTYDVTLDFVDDDEAKFTVNGEATNKLKVGETYVLSDKSEVGVSEILYQSYAGGVHSTDFFVGASKMEIRDDSITTAGGSHDLKVGSEDIDGAVVIVTGTNDNTTFSVSTIELNMTAQDDFFVAAGDKLSETLAAAGEEKELLFNGGFDVEYQGLTTEEVHDLRLKSSSSRRYKLALFDGDGNAVDIPLAYAEDAFDITVGEDAQSGGVAQKRLVLNETTLNDMGSNARNSTEIFKDDYFVVTSGTASDGSAKSYLLQYKGADKDTKTSPSIKFKNVGSGETLDYSVTAATKNAVRYSTVATIKIGGNSFIVQNASSTLADDFNVYVDLDGSGAIAGETDASDLITWVDYYGSEWTMDTRNATTRSVGYGLDSIKVKVNPAVNANDFDNVNPTNFTLLITPTAGPEVRAGITGVTLLTPDGETEVSYGYLSNGAFITFNEPASDPDDMTMSYPEAQRLPQVFFTSGSTSSASKVSGSWESVEIVEATKLDSEIASVTAQNLVVVGGPCVNTVAADLLGNPSDCTEGFTPGKARVKLFEHANGNVAMLVAGYSGQDTRLAGKVVANRWTELSGDEVEIEGTTYSDATISKAMSN